MITTLARLALCLLPGLICASVANAQHGSAPAPESIDIPEGGVVMAMQDFGGRPVVEVTINGAGPYRFILDTGADISVIDTALAAELSLSRPTQLPAAVDGEGSAPAIVTIAELAIGEATLEGVIAAVMPLAKMLVGEKAPRGVLSAASFPGYLLAYDYPARRITVAEGALDDADEKSIFEYRASDALPTVPISVGGVKTRVHVDTGSGSGLTLPARLLSEVRLASQPKSSGKLKTPIGESALSTAQLDGPIEIGRFRLPAGEVEFSDVQSGSGPPAGQIGYRILRSFTVTLDSRHRRVRLARSE